MSKINGVETEWSMLQRKVGNLPALEKETEEELPERPSRQEYLDSLSYDKLQQKLEMNVANDDEEQIMLALKQKRLLEMKQQAEKDKFGSLTTIQANEYISEVSTASKEVPVVVHLYSEKEECRVLDVHLHALASKHKYVKFVRIKGCLAIPNFPDKNCPTLIIYNNGENKGQIVGLSQFGGVNKISTLAVELALARLSIFQSVDLEELIDQVVGEKKKTTSYAKKKKPSRKYGSDSEDLSDDDD